MLRQESGKQLYQMLKEVLITNLSHPIRIKFVEQTKTKRYRQTVLNKKDKTVVTIKTSGVSVVQW